MANVFSVTIFFIVFRTVIEVSFIVAILLGFIQQFLHKAPALDFESNPTTVSPRALRRLRLQVTFGTLAGLFSALVIGAAFIGIWYTQATDLWTNIAELWEGVVQLIASLLIFVVGIAMLRAENAREDWRLKVQNAFDGHQSDSGVTTSKWVLFILPFITVLREGLEAVAFVGGVALGLPAAAIPIPTIVGIICGIASGVILYQFATRTTFKLSLVFITNLLLLMGAGLFSKAVWSFQENDFYNLIGATADDFLGTGPGSYDVRGNVWHLDFSDSTTGSWSLLNALFGWQNSGTLGSVLSYVFYWVAVIVVLVFSKFHEGRTTVFGWESANRKYQAEEISRRSETSSENNSQPEKTAVNGGRA